MAVRAVIFDWGGTLTPWHSVDQEDLWLAVCARHYPAAEAAGAAAAARAAEMELWRLAECAGGSPMSGSRSGRLPSTPRSRSWLPDLATAASDYIMQRPDGNCGD